MRPQVSSAIRRGRLAASQRQRTAAPAPSTLALLALVGAILRGLPSDEARLRWVRTHLPLTCDELDIPAPTPRSRSTR